MPIASAGSVVQANWKLSAIAGAAFVDFGAVGVLTQYPNTKLTILDSAGKALVGYIAGLGTGETYGAEMLPNTAFNNTTDLGTIQTTIASVAGGQAGNCLEVTSAVGADGCSAIEDGAGAAGMLIKLAAYGKIGTATSFALLIQDALASTWLNKSQHTDATFTLRSVYATAIDTAIRANFFSNLWDSAIGTKAYFDTASMKQVLTPSVTGVTIVSERFGSVRDWASEEAGFNRNDASGYTYTTDKINSLSVSVPSGFPITANSHYGGKKLV